MEKIHFSIKNENLSAKSTLAENILKGAHSLSTLEGKKGLLFSTTVLE
jgi:hypothetical protein